MKAFSLYLGDPGEIGTADITSDKPYEPVVNAVQQIRDRLLQDEILRQPYLDLFTSVYHDNTPFPDELKQYTPDQDQIPNQTKVRQIRHQPPTDTDVIDYLTNAFPDIYLISAGEFGTKGTLWGETISGIQAVGQERIGINAELIRAWLSFVSGLNLQHFFDI